MNHETLQALYQLDVAEVGEEEAAKRWEYYSGWVWQNNRDCTGAVPPNWNLELAYRRKPGIPWPKVMQPDNPWRKAVEDAAVVYHTYNKGFTAGEQLSQVLNAVVTIALDPQVSSGAQALIDKGKAMQQDTQAYKEAASLAVSLWERCYKAKSPEFLVLDDLQGVLSQLSNMIAGLPIQPSTQWPDDAPEWANYMTTDESGGRYYHKKLPYPKSTCACWFSGSSIQHKVVCPNWRDTLIERPKPAKQKIDWSKLPLNVHRHMRQTVGEGEPWSYWVAWNCDEHTRGNPLPDGLVFEWLYHGKEPWHNRIDSFFYPDWDEVTRFRIVGIQEGWE